MYSSNVHICLAGHPPTIVFEGISLFTKLFAAMKTLSPIVTPLRMVTLYPVPTLFPIVTWPDELKKHHRHFLLHQ